MHATPQQLRPDFILTLLIGMFSCTQGMCQDSIPEQLTPDKQSRFSIGANFSPDLGYRTLVNNNGAPIYEVIIDMRDESEVPLAGYTGGAVIEFACAGRFALESGIQFSNKRYGSGKNRSYFGDQIDPRYGFIYAIPFHVDTAGLENIRYAYSQYYLDVPLRAVCFWGSAKKFRFIASAGITANIFIKATTTAVMKYDDGDTERIRYDQDYNFNPICLSLTASAGIDYTLNEKFRLRAEPVFRYGISKIVDEPVSGYLWNVGLNITCYYKL